jgi:hypothetical protein
MCQETGRVQIGRSSTRAGQAQVDERNAYDVSALTSGSTA